MTEFLIATAILLAIYALHSNVDLSKKFPYDLNNWSSLVLTVIQV